MIWRAWIVRRIIGVKNKMKKKISSPILAQILKKLAPKIGARVLLEPKWKIVGQIIYKNGKKKYFRYSTVDLNSVGASEISKDKDYATFFMKKMGYPTVPGKSFFSAEWSQAIGSSLGIDAAYWYAKTIGFPVIVKPNSGSQGFGVSLVHNKNDFYKALRFIFKKDKVALVQQVVSGKDYRVVVLDNRVISVYQRVSLNVVGDGLSTIKQLLNKKQKEFIAASRDTQIKSGDPRIFQKLKHQGLSFKSKPVKGERIFLLDNANLSTGGDSLDVTANIHPEFRKIAIKLTKDMGLRMCGVDLMVAGDISEKPKKYWVLETNAAPGLDHYARSGKAQEKIVEDLYLEVLKSMGE